MSDQNSVGKSVVSEDFDCLYRRKFILGFVQVGNLFHKSSPSGNSHLFKGKPTTFPEVNYITRYNSNKTYKFFPPVTTGRK